MNLFLLEFEKYINLRYNVKKEVVFNKIMDTKRRFRADYLLNDNIIVEINGGQWVNGRHNRGGKGYGNDLTKSNIANFNDFKYFQFTYEMLKSLEYENFI